MRKAALIATGLLISAVVGVNSASGQTTSPTASPSPSPSASPSAPTGAPSTGGG